MGKLNFWLKNIVYAVIVSFVFYSALIAGDLFGFREISARSFDFVSLIVTFLTFSTSILNIRFR